MISMICRIDGRMVRVWTLFMASMIHTWRVATWPTRLLSDTNMWATRVALYNSSILSLIMTL